MDSTLVKDDPNTGVKEGVDQDTVDAVREVGGAYKYGGPQISRWTMPRWV